MRAVSDKRQATGMTVRGRNDAFCKKAKGGSGRKSRRSRRRDSRKTRKWAEGRRKGNATVRNAGALTGQSEMGNPFLRAGVLRPFPASMGVTTEIKPSAHRAWD
jgi:hypothetical protein